MADFYQNGIVTTLHNLTDRPVEDLERELEDIKKNKCEHKCNRIDFIKFLMTTFLSYIEENDPHLSQGDVRFEPITALTSGKDGLNDIRTIAQHAWIHLNPQGWLLIEHGYHQANAVATILKEHQFSHIQLIHDLSGNHRVTLGQKPE